MRFDNKRPSNNSNGVASHALEIARAREAYASRLAALAATVTSGAAATGGQPDVEGCLDLAEKILSGAYARADKAITDALGPKGGPGGPAVA